MRSEYRQISDQVARAANRADWDAEADDYQHAHGEFLGDARFVWCPEGLDEESARILGDPDDLDGLRVLDLGCGAAQCARWLGAQGATAVGVDLSFRQLQHARRIDEETSSDVPVVCGSASDLPFAEAAFDLVVSAFGALPFVVDIEGALGEVARVLRPGGRCAFSVVHPVRRMFPDDPTASGLTVTRSYFDRAAYVEVDSTGRPTYAEPHHTLSDWVTALQTSGLVLERIEEPEWPDGHTRVWGGWGPVRGRLLPGTAIFVASKG